jgi:hypothetical protein
MNAEIDVRAVLPSIQVPTLILHRTGDRCLKVEEGRYLASKIPTAALVELSGEDHLPFVGDQDAILDEIERFLSATPATAAPERVLATVLTVCADTRAEDREHLRRVFAREVAAHRGQLMHAADARLVAMFDGPCRAGRCGCSVAVVAGRSNIGVRAGVHIGWCEPAATTGPLADISAAIAAAAAAGEVLVSRTIVDLVPGSGLQFAERGIVSAPGVAAGVPVLSVTSPVT